MILPAYFLLACLLVCATNWLEEIPWRRSTGAHWTERARILYPARVGASANQWTIPAILLLGGIEWGPATVIPWPLLALAGFLGATIGTYPFARQTLHGLTLRTWSGQVGMRFVLLFCTAGVLVLAAMVMPANFGWQTWLVTTLALALQIYLRFGGGERLMRILGVLRPPPERLRRIVSEAARAMNMPVPGIWLLHTPLSYAVAFPVTKSVACSERLLELHPDDEVAAICAHELGHLTESRPVVAIRILRSLAFFPLILTRPVIATFPGLPIPFLLAPPYLLILIFRRLSRRMEIRADRLACENQTEPGIFARALERLCEANGIPVVMTGRGVTHPHTYDRLVAAGITPAYPRPKAPNPISITGIIAAALLGLMGQ